MTVGVLPATKCPKGQLGQLSLYPHGVSSMDFSQWGKEMEATVSRCEDAWEEGGWDPRHREIHVDIMDNAF